MIPVLWTFLTSRVGMLVGAALAVFIFYEGIPIGPLGKIPVVGPVLSEITDGRVDRASRAALNGYVLVAERDALAARLDEERRQKLAASEAADWLRMKVLGLEVQAALEDEKVEQEYARYEKELADAGRSCHLNDADLEWLRK